MAPLGSLHRAPSKKDGTLATFFAAAAMPHAVLVGASRGIGLAIARKFVQHGIGVTLVARNEDTLRNSVSALRQCTTTSPDVSIEYTVCDITNENDINKCCQQVLSSLAHNRNSLDILINSAGIVYNKLLATSDSESMKKVLDTNLLGTILFTRALLKPMLRQKRGAIINIGSIVGTSGNVGQTVYAASKAGLVGFTKSLAKELGPKGITANVISPGFIETDMTAESLNEQQIEEMRKSIPLRRIGSADEVAIGAYFLATNSFITGQVLNIDGGLSLTF